MAFEIERVGDKIRVKFAGMTKWREADAAELECIWQAVTTAKRYPKLRRIKVEIIDGNAWVTVAQMQPDDLRALLPPEEEDEQAE